MNRFRKSAGFTLIELILTATIGIFIAAMVYSGYRVMERDQKVKQTSDLIDMLMNDAVMASASRNDFQIPDAGGTETPITLALLLDVRGNDDEYPSGTSVSGGIMNHPFNGEVNASANSTDGGASQDLMRLDLTEVPSAACIRLLSRQAGHMYDMYVDNNLVGLTPEREDGALGRNEVRVDQASALCSADDKVTVSFRKMKDINFSDLRVKPLGNALTPAEELQIRPLYDRQENALNDREAAQLAIP